MELPEPHDAVLGVCRQRSEIANLLGEMFSTWTAREEVVDVVDHGHDDSALAADIHFGVSHEGCVHRQGVDQGPDGARVAS